MICDEVLWMTYFLKICNIAKCYFANMKIPGTRILWVSYWVLLVFQPVKKSLFAWLFSYDMYSHFIGSYLLLSCDGHGECSSSVYFNLFIQTELQWNCICNIAECVQNQAFRWLDKKSMCYNYGKMEQLQCWSIYLPILSQVDVDTELKHKWCFNVWLNLFVLIIKRKLN